MPDLWPFLRTAAESRSLPVKRTAVAFLSGPSTRRWLSHWPERKVRLSRSGHPTAGRLVFLPTGISEELKPWVDQRRRCAMLRLAEVEAGAARERSSLSPVLRAQSIVCRRLAAPHNRLQRWILPVSQRTNFPASFPMAATSYISAAIRSWRAESTLAVWKERNKSSFFQAI